MSQRLMLIIAAALTAFILVMGSGLVTYIAQTADQTVSGPTATAIPATGLDPTVEALVKEREQAYQQALDEANRQLAQANQQLAQQSASSTSAAQPGVSLSPEQAQTIALNMAPGAKLTKAAELVSYQGTPAYEVVLDRGAIYVHAQSGAILASSIASNQADVETNTTAPDALSPEQAAQIAVGYRRSGTVSSVSSIYDGTVYEISFNDGVVMYIDSVSGQLLQVQQAAPGEHEHEHDDHDEDENEHEEQEG